MIDRLQDFNEKTIERTYRNGSASFNNIENTDEFYKILMEIAIRSLFFFKHTLPSDIEEDDYEKVFEECTKIIGEENILDGIIHKDTSVPNICIITTCPLDSGTRIRLGRLFLKGFKKKEKTNENNRALYSAFGIRKNI